MSRWGTLRIKFGGRILFAVAVFALRNLRIQAGSPQAVEMLVERS